MGVLLQVEMDCPILSFVGEVVVNGCLIFRQAARPVCQITPQVFDFGLSEAYNAALHPLF
ncbi:MULTISPECIES: hypothetical protein [unclassified Bradyrhizobium]